MAKGFNRPQMPAGGGGMMNQLKRMQEQLAVAQEQLAQETVTATVGGGAVKVTVTGDQHTCTAVVIDPELLKDADAEMLQDLLLSAVNLALEQSRKLQEERMGPLTGGLGGLGF